MAVISITITASAEQIISGIPRSVSISTNISATIFYTLDGSTPTLFSTIYTGPIQLPTDPAPVILSVFATNGIDTSPVVVNTYETDLLGQDARFPHSGTDAQPNSTQGAINPAPFGSPPIQPNQQFLGPAEAGLTVDNPLLPPGKPTGFDANGNPTGFTNDQFIGIPSQAFPIQFTTKNEQGLEGPGIGTLPRSSIVPDRPPPEQSDITSPLFDPRALVILQDLTKPQDPNVPPHINRMYFTLEDVEHTREGNQFFNTGLDAPPVSGTFLRQHYNPRDNTITYYYLDTTQNRWIISKTPFVPKPSYINNYANGIVFGKNKNVYSWIPFKASILY